MIERLLLNHQSLPAQMIAGFVLVVVLTTLTIGLPAIGLIHQQLDRQAWAMVEQGQRAIPTFLEATQNEISSLARLTAERPTLHAMLQSGNRQILEQYLINMESAATYDLITICDHQNRLVATTDENLDGSICLNPSARGLYLYKRDELSQVMLIAKHPLPPEAGINGSVIIATHMDREFATQMSAYSSLEIILWVENEIVASSFKGDYSILASLFRQPVNAPASGGIERNRFHLLGKPYYLSEMALDSPGTTVEVALLVDDLVQAEKRLVGIIIGGMLLVAVLGSALGIYLARRTSLPLVTLAERARGFSQGDLSTPVQIETNLREAVLLAQTLEDSRANLQQTLTDLRREKTWSNHLLESISEGIMTLDMEMHITFFSHGAEQITGWKRGEVLQRPCDELFSLAETERPFSQVIPYPGQRGKVVVKLADGRLATLALTAAHLSDLETGDSQVVVFRDISEEDLVHHLLGFFIANVVHEFQTPLSAINASIELLLSHDASSQPEERYGLLKGLQVSIVNLQTLVNNLLESASFEVGHFHVSPRPYDLRDLISEAVRFMQPLMEKYNQSLRVNLPPSIPLVLADPRRVVQVLVNLLSNASKYGPADHIINLDASLEDGFMRISIGDRGPGISPERRANLFRRFINPDTKRENLKVGAGLGLSVVKAVVEAHGGQVGVEDQHQGGTIFWFTLPVDKEL